MKSKFLLIGLILISAQAAKSQKAVRVTYEVTPLAASEFFNDIFKSSLVVVFNDSLVYSYFVHDRNDPMRKKQEAYGSYFINHGSYSRRGESGYFHPSILNHKSTTKDSSRVKLVHHTFRPPDWTF